MTNPFRYRPGPSTDVDHDGEIADWEDTPLSNAFAWTSVTFTPTWCQNETHWTARFATTLWSSCPCCTLFRGIVIGIVLSIPPWILSLALTAYLAD